MFKSQLGMANLFAEGDNWIGLLQLPFMSTVGADRILECMPALEKYVICVADALKRATTSSFICQLSSTSKRCPQSDAISLSGAVKTFNAKLV
jgi:hypothetical protein